ncbi:odorant receptor 10-like [Halyomorpha halys]|uniref:odorant receptor 10-like n=1 Tax=Halyomorpha halys TaxID=286706 RepID=UPI0034D34226|nr:Odorant receptor 45 [Halyomorpha halys]
MDNQGAILDSDIIDGLDMKYLKFFGLWKIINDYRTTRKKNSILKFKVITTLFLTIPYIVSQYLSYWMIEVDIQKATFLNLHSLPALQICCKVLVLWFRIDSQSRLFNLLKKDFFGIPKSKEGEAKSIFSKMTSECNKLCSAAFLINTSVVILSIIDPGISVDYIMYHTGNMHAVTSGKKKILGGWYPLPIDKSPYYEAVFVYEILLIIWGGILLAVYVCLFYQVLMCLYAQFSVLALQVSTLKYSYIQDGKGRESVNSKLYKELYEVIKEHQKILRYAEELRSVYNPLVTMILGVGIFVLIIAVFQFLFGSTGNPMFIFRSLQFLAYQGIEVSMFCFGSSYIQNASSDLHFAIYSSDWYKADVKFRKAAQMMMIRAKKGVTLTATRIYPVNVETIMAMLQFTYSVSALMSRMTE